MSTRPKSTAAHTDVVAGAVESARAARLRYVSDDIPGISRRRAGRGFKYLDEQGKQLHDREVLARIKSLGIPPAWTDVWISPYPHGHLQATGRDDRGRKQYRYHPRWRQVRDDVKYGQLIAFGRALPRIRRRVARDLARKELDKRKVLATIVRLLETTFIRVGNEEYAKENGSYGLTTMRDRHIEIRGAKLEFAFRGKSSRKHKIVLTDYRLARIVRRCQEIPGQELFQYLDGDGERRTVSSEDVNEYLREISGEDFTAKDFRTWAGTVLAAMALRELSSFDTEAAAKANIRQAIESVAGKLGNTPTICRKCYVHPEIVKGYLDGTLIESLGQRAGAMMDDLPNLEPEEAAVLALLQRRLAEQQV
jgi:DNA topoisomerase-1